MGSLGDNFVKFGSVYLCDFSGGITVAGLAATDFTDNTVVRLVSIACGRKAQFLRTVTR